MKRRLNGVVAIVMIAVIAYLVFTMVRLSIIDAAKWQELASSQQLKSTTITASRGTIYDSNMQILAQSATVYTIAVDPVLLARNLEEEECELTLSQVVTELSQMLEMDYTAIETKCLKDNRYQELKKNVEKPQADIIKQYARDNKLSAIIATESSKRFYPENSLAASVIGHLHYDGYGIYGLEAYYDDYLSGTDGKTLIATDNRGNEIPYDYKQSYDAQPGDSLVLNIDITIQSALENALLDCVETHAPLGRATGIIMNPNTGAVYAMASTYGYDLNNPAEITNPITKAEIDAMPEGDDKTNAKSTAWATQWKNKAISEIYFPGSVFKVITASSALEEQTINIGQHFGCGMVYKVADTDFHCWATYDHYSQTLYDAMMNSCNPAFIRIGETLQPALFSKYYAAYGFTEKTGIDLPGEVSSLYVPEERMGPVELGSSSFGQTNKVTAIEMITAYAAVVNGGYLVTPQVVDKIIDSNGNVVKDIEPVIKRQVISEDTSAQMRDVLEYVVENAKGGNSYISGYRIGGKSGTSQKIDEDITGHTYVGSYCAFAPADDPQVILLIAVDDPQNGEFYGSQVAAPYATQVLEAILPYLGIYPEYTEEQLEEIAVSIKNTEFADVEDAKATLGALGLNVTVIGNGDSVVTQVPSSGQTKRGSTVILYTEANAVQETATVPSLAGLTLEEAEKRLAEVGLNLLPSGSAAYTDGATAGYDQSQAAGTVVLKGSVVSVTFYPKNVSSQ
ncbi:MAG: PASTA domain-containing protein [Oscillospiraceae bacterium]|nr:PASTA domain-containing protein [Oscillospiraceae bacterium]